MNEPGLYEKGQRIRLTHPMQDDPDPIPVGTEGTITWAGGIVRLGNTKPYEQLGVQWDNGRTLGLCVPPDRIEVIE